VPSLGGEERRLIDVTGVVPSPTDGSLIPFLSWSPDGEWLALAEKPRDDQPSRIVRLSLATLEKTPLTFPPAASLGDRYPELSPDGKRLAFVRGASRIGGLQDVWVQSVSGQPARQLTFATYDYCSGVAWTADGTELVFSTQTQGMTAGGEIVRVSLAGGNPMPLAGVGRDVAWPSIRSGRMVHAQLVAAPWGIWRIPGRRSAVADRRPEKLIASRWNDTGGAYSPDGRRIAFGSDRSGTHCLWVSNEDGSNPVQLTAFDSGINPWAPWSPDGRRIVFTSKESGNYDLYLVDSDGGRPQRLTHEPSEDIAGSFSRDGRFIYFSSDRSGTSRIWKMPAEGGPAVQVTREDGYFVQESWDARTVYYLRTDGEIWRVPTEGGEETPVLRIRQGFLSGWNLSQAGLYYATTRYPKAMGEEYTVSFLDFETGRTETLFRSEGSLFGTYSLEVSPDEKWILYSEQAVAQSELMLVENFR
jgi:Tol biopolymer transport system component